MTREPEDQLLSGVTLDHVVCIPVLGRAVEFASNQSTVVELARNSFGPEAPSAGASSVLYPPVARVRIVVHPGEENSPSPWPVQYRSPGPDRLIVNTPGSVGVAERERGEAYAFITEALLAEQTCFQRAILEALTLMLLAGPSRGPLHAATLSLDRAGLLLMGRSGSGKSTLSYAAHREGIAVLGEEVAYLETEPRFAVWTVPGRIHLAADALQFFPELAGQKVQRLPNGKQKLVVRTEVAPARDALPLIRAGACLLERGNGPVGVQVIAPEELFTHDRGRLESGFDFFRDAALGAMRGLERHAVACWRLRLSSDPLAAVPIIRQLLRELAGT